MKKNGFLITALIFCFFAFNFFLHGQNNSFRLNVNGFRKYDRAVEVVYDSIQSNNNPKSNVAYQNNDLSLTFFRKIKKIEAFIGAGYSWGSSDYDNSRDIDTLLYQEKTNQEQKGFQLHLGMLKAIPIQDTDFKINAGVGVLFEYVFFDSYFSEYSLVTPIGSYSLGQSLNIEYSDRTLVGPNFEVGFYYTLLDKISIGINHNSWFYWEDNNGTNLYESKKYSADKALIGITKSRQVIKGKNLGKSHFFSFSCQYQF